MTPPAHTDALKPFWALALLVIANFGHVIGQATLSPPGRACIVTSNQKGCLDITAECKRLGCHHGEVCARSVANQTICLPETAIGFRNCGSEQLRLSQPCPADAEIKGFGQDCTFCTGIGIGRGARIETGISPPAPPATSLRVSPPSPPPRVDTSPPAPPSLPRACVFRHIRNGEFKKQCVDINERCEQKKCPSHTMCGLDLNEELQCFPKSYKDAEFCGSEEFLLSQPCPQDSGIRGFGRGCNYCLGGNPFVTEDFGREERYSRLQVKSPSTSPRVSRLISSVTPGSSDFPENISDRACVSIHTISGDVVTETCVDISAQCKRRGCMADTVCGLNLSEQIECFPASVREIQNCGSEEVRLSQPCPMDTGLIGFGMGCTFCQGGNPFVTTPYPLEPKPSHEPSPSAGLGSVGTSQVIGVSTFPNTSNKTACIVPSTFGPGHCVDIAADCSRLGCSGGEVCVVTTEGKFTCLFPTPSMHSNCGGEELRRLQPCPADTGIVGFGMGCTYCQGEVLTPPTPPPQPQPTPSGRQLACVSRVTSNGVWRRGCLDLTKLCAGRGCPADRTCALDSYEQPSCFAPSQLPISNCASPQQRLSQPCPADTQVVAYGTGCTYCRGVTPLAPVPANNRRACIVTGARRECIDISATCAVLGCSGSSVCGLGLDGQPQCFTNHKTHVRICASERRRLDQPCPGLMRAALFGAGCTYCGL